MNLPSKAAYSEARTAVDFGFSEEPAPCCCLSGPDREGDKSLPPFATLRLDYSAAARLDSRARRRLGGIIELTVMLGVPLRVDAFMMRRLDDPRRVWIDILLKLLT